jgi:hypothetical protein
MCTYNGGRWLRAQLDSIAAQDLGDWALVVSDDGSSDDTLDIVRAFAQHHPVTLYETTDHDTTLAPSQRAARNYMQTLTRRDLPIGPSTYVALADQDDIWRSDKLSHAVAVLRAADTPVALYGGQSRHVQVDGTPIVLSRPPRRAVGLYNALVQNSVSGHSAVLTAQAVVRLRQAGLPAGIWYHDWWLYLLIAATGGDVLVDDHVGLDYRQHDTNVMGAGRGTLARRRRLQQIFNGEYGGWIRANLTALATCNANLTPDARTALAMLNPTLGVMALWRSGAYRHSPLEMLCILIAGSLHKL